MALSVLSANSIGTGTRFNPGAGDSGLVLEGVSAVSTNFEPAVVMDDQETMTIHGTVAGEVTGLYVRNASGTAFGNRVLISDTGNVTAAGRAVDMRDINQSLTNAGEILGGTTGIFASGTNMEITNDGLIHASTGISGSGSGIRIVNTGTLNGSDRAILLNTNGVNLLNTGTIMTRLEMQFSVGSTAPMVVENSGTIVSQSYRAFNMIGATSMVVVNSGEITGSVKFSPGSGATATVLENSGLLTNMDETMPVIDGWMTGPDHVWNTSAIMGGLAGTAIALRGSADLLVNGGEIVGDADLGDGADKYRARDGGWIEGSVLGQDGADTLIGSTADDALDGGAGPDAVFGGGGNDTLDGRAGDDILRGGDGHDTVSGGGDADTVDGGAGDDFLSGGYRADLLLGRDGDDTLVGGGDNGFDTLRGGRGDDDAGGGEGRDLLVGGGGDDSLFGGEGFGFDTLRGGAGDDSLDAGAGNDTLDGGRGTDLLTTGQGADVIVFAPGDGADRVTDFTDGVDRLDLTGWGFANHSAFAGATTLRAGSAGLMIDFDAGDSLFLAGMSAGQLSGADLIL